jgi:uncharacterized protein with FMN-binding domain
MQRTLSLIGLLVIGILLLFNPDTGMITAVASDVAVAQPVTAEAPATTGEPPPPEVPTAGSPPTTTTPPTTVGTYSVLGESVASEFGLFQVEIIIEGGVMVDVVTVSEPADRKSKRINRDAIPVYEEAAISTQSAEFDAISGATVTWGAYTASLQSALDEAGL